MATATFECHCSLTEFVFSVTDCEGLGCMCWCVWILFHCEKYMYSGDCALVCCVGECVCVCVMLGI